MYLVGITLLPGETYRTPEAHYLSHTRHLLAESLGKPSTNIIQWLQAASLMSFYLWKMSRYLEARQEASD